MKWELYIYDQSGANLLASYSDSSPGPIVGGFNWRIGPGGDCLQLVFTAVPKDMPWPIDLCAVQLRIGGTPVFFGAINQFWPRDETDAREYVAVGISELYKRRFAISPRYDNVPVENIVDSLVANYRHHLSTVGTIENTGQNGTVAAPGPIDLYTLMSDLAKQVGFVWGVDASGAFFFKRASSEVSAGYYEHGIGYLPANASEVVTKGIVFGGEQAAGGTLWINVSNSAGVATIANEDIEVVSKRLYATYEAPEHQTYGLEKAAVSPVLKTSQWNDPSALAGASIIKLLGGANQSFNGTMVCSTSGGVEDTIDETSTGGPNESTGWKAIIGEPSGVYTTLYAAWNLSLPDWAAWGGSEAGRVVLRVGLLSNKSFGRDISLTVSVSYPDPDNPSLVITKSSQLDVGMGGDIEVFIGGLPANASVKFEFKPITANYTLPSCSTSSDYIMITYVRGWGTIIPDAIEAAKSLVSLPYQEPTEVEWTNEIVSPADFVKLETMSSTATAPVAEWEFSYTPTEKKSVAKLGDRGLGDDAAVLRVFVSDTGAKAAVLGAST